ncbi:MAG TPA: hypothetical protein VKY41_07855 [Xanthomarina sp.]|nr:hypothetical protein [Xanthomarina sp.]
MKNYILLFTILLLRVPNCLGQEVKIGSYTLAAQDSNYINFTGVGTDDYTLIEIWNQNTWLNYLKYKDDENYSPISSVKGRCYNRTFNNLKNVSPGVYIFRVVYHYNSPDKREEHIKTLDTRNLNSQNKGQLDYIPKTISVNGFVLTSVSPYVLELVNQFIQRVALYQFGRRSNGIYI